MTKVLKIIIALCIVISILIILIIFTYSTKEYEIEGTWNYIRTNQILDNEEETELDVLEFFNYPPTLEIKDNELILMIYDANISGSIERTDRYSFKSTNILTVVNDEIQNDVNNYIIKYNNISNELRIEPLNSGIAYYFKRTTEMN